MLVFNDQAIITQISVLLLISIGNFIERCPIRLSSSLQSDIKNQQSPLFVLFFFSISNFIRKIYTNNIIVIKVAHTLTIYFFKHFFNVNAMRLPLSRPGIVAIVYFTTKILGSISMYMFMDVRVILGKVLSCSADVFLGINRCQYCDNNNKGERKNRSFGFPNLFYHIAYKLGNVVNIVVAAATK